MTDAADAKRVAEDVWRLFGPVSDNAANRPFGKAVVDGFDFDLESPVTNLDVFAASLRELIDRNVPSAKKKIILSGTPQCQKPDINIGAVLDAVQFDLVMIQFYNNPCQALTYVRTGTTAQSTYNFEAWSTWAESIKGKPKLLIGLPADTGAASTGFPTIAELTTIVSDAVKKYPNTFAGLMMWDMSRLMDNPEYFKGVVAALVSTTTQDFPSAAVQPRREMARSTDPGAYFTIC